jgi:type VI secretion system secreted protein VgrG
MDSPLKQDTRSGRLTTPLGQDVLVLARFEGNEGLSELFEYRVEAHSKDEVNYDSLLGKACTVTMESYGHQRQFNGILVEAQWIGKRYDLHVHRLVLRPWLWLCSRTSDCRFFQEKTAPEIIQEVFQDRGFTDFRLSLSETHPKREYCVQYRETDFAFVSRLMEHEGMYYFFEHTSDKHTLVLADSMSAHSPVPGHATMPYIDLGNAEAREKQHIYQLISERRFRTGKVELNEYNELQSKADQKASKKGDAKYTRSDMEFYDYPGKYKNRGDGERYAKFVLEAEQALDERRHTSGNAVSLFPGGLTKLKDHPKESENTDYLIVRSSHLYVAEYYRSTMDLGVEEYSGQFELLPKKGSKVFRAPIVTPKPLIHGIQTAKVVGEEGEEIDVDKHGRIKVEFFWDRKKKQSCRIRVAQVWSGKTWGGQIIPRIGQEAVVEFLEGDPDRPLVIGTVYNDEYMHPYELPSKKTQSGLKSDSTKGGGGYNEWKFEDKKGSEEITIHAQKDLDITVLNKETRTIGQNFLPPKGSPSRETAIKFGDDSLKIELGDQTVSIPLGKQSTSALMSISFTTIPSSVTITPASISMTAPTINITGMAVVNVTAPVINLTGVVNLTGMLNITGGLTVNTMVPVLIPA